MAHRADDDPRTADAPWRGRLDPADAMREAVTARTVADGNARAIEGLRDVVTGLASDVRAFIAESRARDEGEDRDRGGWERQAHDQERRLRVVEAAVIESAAERRAERRLVAAIAAGIGALVSVGGTVLTTVLTTGPT